MPPSALDRLGKELWLPAASCYPHVNIPLLKIVLILANYSTASLHIDYPMLFELRNAATERVSHCGVLEFIAEEGMIYMPYWVGATR